MGRVGVFEEAIGRAIVNRQPAGNIVSHGTGHRKHAGGGVVLTVAASQKGFKFVRGALGGHDDSTGRRGATVQGALGSLQHFDLRQIGVLAVERRGVGVQDAVHDEGKVGFAIPRAIDSAYGQLAVSHLHGVDEGYAGGHVDKVLGPLDTGVPDL